MSVEISIIMPMYNTESYLDECMRSILGQSYKSWELIVVDDFSTDGSASLVQKYMQLDSRIKLYTNTEKGIIPALQLGYTKSSGRYVTRMDSDDVMPVQKLESLRAALQQEGEVAVGKVSYFSKEKDMAEGYTAYAEWLNTLIDANSHYQNVYKECVIPSPCWMMSRSTFEKIGGFHGYGYPEDYDLVFRMYVAGITVKPVDEVLHLWRDHDTRASRTDPNYSDQSFLPLKLHYFIEYDYIVGETLCLWGAGRAGKALAKLLAAAQISFDWYTDNPNKIGHNIYGVKLRGVNSIRDTSDNTILTAIRTPMFVNDNERLLQKLTNQGNRIIHFH